MILLMGVAGAGKSMQGKIMADEHGYAWISTGEILRVLVTGRRRQQMLEGKLLSDDEMIAILDKVFDLIDTDQEFVLDGFPRTVPQADWLLEQSRGGRLKLNAVIHLMASEQVVRERLVKRARLDDSEEAITKRFEEYNTVTVPIIEHLKESGVPICDIDAAQTPREVHDAILKCLD
ncbi:MAG TPA: nucleoside monophosphate kinase [Candidatus Saccharimonadales bacterium]|nr:nucleoside monophosphate kinase [Candidatus Saccharimonadales bacterium]